MILRDICKLVDYGYTASSSAEAIGPKFLRITDVVGDMIDWVTVPHCKIEDRKYDRYRLHPGDIVIARTGATTGYAKWIKDPHGAVFASYLVRLRVVPDVDSRFIGYIVESQEYKEFIDLHRGGAAQPNANAQVLTSYPVKLPELLVQKRIAQILSAYDNLIENNTRRIQILEEMAQAIYREWFMNFRFPGHDRLELVNGLPEGWDRKTIAAACEPANGVQTGPFGSQLHQSDYTDEGVPVVMPKNLVHLRISEQDIARVPEIIAENLIRHRMRESDVVYGRRGDIGRRAYITSRHSGWLCGTGCLRLRPNRDVVAPLYFFDALGAPDTAASIAAHAVGATMPNLNSKIFKNVSILIPPMDLQRGYVDRVEPMVALIETLDLQSRKLSQTRDLLLPMLISGEVSLDVAELENLAA